MAYTLNISTGIVTRNTDNKQVAPAQSTDDPDYMEYINWIVAGNTPTEVNVPVSSSTRKITKLAFRNRLTTAEKLSIEMASLDNPSADIQLRQLAAMLRVYIADTNSATFIDLDREDTQIGILALAQYGIITPERAQAIINNPIQPHECPSV